MKERLQRSVNASNEKTRRPKRKSSRNSNARLSLRPRPRKRRKNALLGNKRKRDWPLRRLLRRQQRRRLARRR